MCIDCTFGCTHKTEAKTQLGLSRASAPRKRPACPSRRTSQAAGRQAPDTSAPNSRPLMFSGAEVAPTNETCNPFADSAPCGAQPALPSLPRRRRGSSCPAATPVALPLQGAVHHHSFCLAAPAPWPPAEPRLLLVAHRRFLHTLWRPEKRATACLPSPIACAPSCPGSTRRTAVCTAAPAGTKGRTQVELGETNECQQPACHHHAQHYWQGGRAC